MILPDVKNRPVAFEIGSEQQRFFVFVFKQGRKRIVNYLMWGRGRGKFHLKKKCFILSRKNIDINY